MKRMARKAAVLAIGAMAVSAGMAECSATKPTAVAPADRTLAKHALQAMKKAYAPYSNFHVGAAVLAESGKIYEGANIENASYGATVCAERNAIFAAVLAGERRMKAIAVCGGKNGVVTDYCPPCGICRQVMREFSVPSEMKVIVARTPEDVKAYTLEQLLPESFGPDALARP